MIKVSVIIPMYNAKEYIVDCVRRILKQSLKEIEVIIVNDASADGSMDLCRDVFGKDERVRLFDQPRNMGPGAARNRGIREAKGEYITFVDSDDSITEDAYTAMYEAAKANDADILHVTGIIFPITDKTYKSFDELDESDYLRLPMDEGEKITECGPVCDDIGQRISDWLLHRLHWGVWNKLYKRSFILENDIFFGPMKYAEDQVFCFHCLCRAKNYVIFPGNYYIYRTGIASESRGTDWVGRLIKAVGAQLDMPAYMKKAMEGLDYFKKNPAMEDVVIDYVHHILDNAFIFPAFEGAGMDAIKADKRVLDLFVSYFGVRAGFVMREFYKAHEILPEDNKQDLNKYGAILKELKAKQDRGEL